MAVLRGDTARGRRHLEAAINLRDVESHGGRFFKLGLLFERLGMLPVALAAFNRAQLHNKAAAAEAALPVTRLLYRMQRYKDAVHIANQWLRLPNIQQAPFYARMLLWRARSRLQLGDLRDAEKDVLEIASLDHSKSPAEDLEVGQMIFSYVFKDLFFFFFQNNLLFST